MSPQLSFFLSHIQELSTEDFNLLVFCLKSVRDIENLPEKIKACLTTLMTDIDQDTFRRHWEESVEIQELERIQSL